MIITPNFSLTQTLVEFLCQPLHFSVSTSSIFFFSSILLSPLPTLLPSFLFFLLCLISSRLPGVFGHPTQPPVLLSSFPPSSRFPLSFFIFLLTLYRLVIDLGYPIVGPEFLYPFATDTGELRQSSLHHISYSIILPIHHERKFRLSTALSLVESR